MDSNTRRSYAVDDDHRSMDAHVTQVDHREADLRAIKVMKVVAANAGEGWYHDAAIQDDREKFAHPYR